MKNILLFKIWGRDMCYNVFVGELLLVTIHYKFNIVVIESILTCLWYEHHICIFEDALKLDYSI